MIENSKAKKSSVIDGDNYRSSADADQLKFLIHPINWQMIPWIRAMLK
jgi:hypothetical protein